MPSRSRGRGLAGDHELTDRSCEDGSRFPSFYMPQSPSRRVVDPENDNAIRYLACEWALVR